MKLVKAVCIVFCRAKLNHEEELKELRERFAREIEETKASLERKKEEEMASLRHQLASEQVRREGKEGG